MVLTEEFQKANYEYQNAVINQRLHQLFKNNPDLSNQFHSSVSTFDNEVNAKLKEDELKTTVQFHELRAKQKARQDERFSNFNRFIKGSSDLVLSPFRSVLGIAEAEEEGVNKVATSFTGILTNPLTLVVIGGVGYVLYKNTQN